MPHNGQHLSSLATLTDALDDASDASSSDAAVDAGDAVVANWAARASSARTRVAKKRRSSALGSSNSVATALRVEPLLHATDEASRSAFRGEKEAEVLRERQAETRNVLQLSAGQATVVDLVVQQHKSVMLMGPPGVGKTMTLQALLAAFRTQCPERIVVVLAPTNAMVERLQAQNIGAETVHHFFKLQPSDLQTVSMKAVAAMVQNKVQQSGSHPLASAVSVRKLTIILEEGFMIGACLFRLVEYLLRFFGNARRIAGGAQILLTGDPCQMKPVKDGLLFENNQLLCLFDAVVQLKRQHRVRDAGLRAILEHIVNARTNADAALTPAMLRTLDVCSAPFSGGEVDPRDQNPMCSVPIVAPHKATVVRLNAAIFAKLDAMGSAAPRIELPVVSGQVKIDDDNLNFRLGQQRKQRVAKMVEQYTMPEIRRFALVRITTSGDNTVSGQLMRVRAVDSPPTQLATREAQERAIRQEAEAQVAAGKRLYYSKFMPVVMLVPADDAKARPIQLPMAVFHYAVPQYQVQTVASRMSHTLSGKAAHVGCLASGKDLADRMNPRSASYPKVWAAMFPVQLGWARTIHSVQGATLQSLFVAEPDKIWESGMLFMLLFRVRRARDLRLGKRLTAAEWNHIVRLEPKARDFLQRLRVTEDNPTAYMLVNDVRCVYTSTKYLPDGTVVHVREPRLKQAFVNVALKRTSVSDTLLSRSFDARCAGAATKLNTHFTTQNAQLRTEMVRARESMAEAEGGGGGGDKTVHTRKSRVAARVKARQRQRRRQREKTERHVAKERKRRRRERRASSNQRRNSPPTSCVPTSCGGVAQDRITLTKPQPSSRQPVRSAALSAVMM